MAPIHLQALAKRYPNIRATLVEIANLQAVLTLPKPTVHVVSDVHGEDVKLRHVVNNASGALRPLVDKIFGDRLPPADVTELLNIFYYPRESWLALTTEKHADRKELLARIWPRAMEVIRELARRYTLEHVEKIIPDPLDAMFRELQFGRELQRSPAFLDAQLEPFVRHHRDLELVRLIARVVRNLAVGELVVAGDLGDRGPRIDKVIDLLAHQPHVSITWGNHDASWMAACLGSAAAIATVVRVSLRYRRLSQLEEGYGIPMAPLEKLAREVYGDDPCERFQCKGEGLRDGQMMARMQKAAAILQFKVEGQLFRRRPEWKMEDRALLHRIDAKTGVITFANGKSYPLLDTRLPTVDWNDPYKLSPGEEQCLARLTRSFVTSAPLWRHMQFVLQHGQMSLRRDLTAIFHGCVPVDDAGAFLAMTVDGEPRAGKALFDALDVVVQRAFREHAEPDIDLVYYLWTGPLSPCFGKDKMATFETYFIADKDTHKETKNPYFKLIHDAGFCARVLREFGVDEQRGFIVNGHVPVKLEQGEAPIKKSGRAITIDGAFAAAYGDKGFSLVLDANRTYLAQHHHFDGVDAAVEAGTDIVPTVSDVQVYDQPRTVADTETGDAVRAEIVALNELIAAFEVGAIRELE
jgi:fructose-1,6-bisphosphatase-3|nr:fructose-bisphosphatase class III [Kofleriaceae bacterium]